LGYGGGPVDHQSQDSTN